MRERGHLFAQDSRLAIWIWFILASLCFILMLYFTATGKFWFVAWPFLTAGCLFTTFGKNHSHARQYFENTEELRGYWSLRKNWSEYRIYWLYVIMTAIWISIRAGEIIKILEVVR